MIQLQLIKQIMNQRRVRLNKKSQDIIPNFLSKTYDILENADNSKIISWTQNGEQFSVKNITQFTEKILPHYFKHNNYSSFIRQLNMYGFHKVKSDNNNDQTFRHQNFKRNRKQLLSQIKRKVMTDLATKEDIQSQKIKDLNISQELSNMKKKQQQLQKIVDVLVQQNKQILQDNKHLWSKMKKTVEKQEKKIQNVLFLMLLSNNGKNFNQKHNQLEIKDKSHLKDESRQNNNNQAILPFQEINKQNAIDALYRNLLNKKSKIKSKFQDQLFLHNQGEHIKIMNNLMTQLNNNEDNKLKSNMLQIEGEHPINNMKVEQEEIPQSPLHFYNFDPKFPEQNDYEQDDYILTKFELQKSESQFPIIDGEKNKQIDDEESIK